MVSRHVSNQAMTQPHKVIFHRFQQPLTVKTVNNRQKSQILNENCHLFLIFSHQRARRHRQQTRADYLRILLRQEVYRAVQP